MSEWAKWVSGTPRCPVCDGVLTDGAINPVGSIRKMICPAGVEYDVEFEEAKAKDQVRKDKFGRLMRRVTLKGNEEAAGHGNR